MAAILRICLIWMIQFCACRTDRIIFEDNNDRSHTNNVKIPESLLIQMKDIHNITELRRRFLVEDEETYLDRRGPSLSGRRGSTPPVVPSAVITPFAACQPEQQTVEVAKPEQGALLIWPPCVRVRRCSGCCTSKMLTCRPVSTSIFNATVLQMRYDPRTPDAFRNEGHRTISLEQHDRCVCGCKEQPEDCVPGIQEYRESECRCACAHENLAELCVGPKRIWDPVDCLCKCRRVRQCSTGMVFNVLTCRCEVARS